VRLSGALWYDPIYANKHYDNNSFSNHLVNGAPSGGLNNNTKRQFGGPDGELLDAFVFGKINIGDAPLSVRAGRHTIYWGEAFFPAAGNNGISYGQSPIDMAKALSMPGVELKEIFRPLNQISLTLQPTNDLVVAAQYYLQWEPNKFPELLPVVRHRPQHRRPHPAARPRLGHQGRLQPRMAQRHHRSPLPQLFRQNAAGTDKPLHHDPHASRSRSANRLLL
jgi:hypothetical protein